MVNSVINNNNFEQNFRWLEQL